MEGYKLLACKLRFTSTFKRPVNLKLTPVAASSVFVLAATVFEKSDEVRIILQHMMGNNQFREFAVSRAVNHIFRYEALAIVAERGRRIREEINSICGEPLDDTAIQTLNQLLKQLFELLSPEQRADLAPDFVSLLTDRLRTHWHPKDPLKEACQNGYAGIARLLLAQGAEVNKADNHGTTPLLGASQNGHEACVELLLAQGARVNEARINGATALWLACLQGHADIARLLIQQGAVVDKANDGGATPLYAACRFGHETTVQLLLAAGAKIDDKTVGGTTPLWIACAEGHEECARLLRNYTPPPHPEPFFRKGV